MGRECDPFLWENGGESESLNKGGIWGEGLPLDSHEMMLLEKEVPFK